MSRKACGMVDTMKTMLLYPKTQGKKEVLLWVSKTTNQINCVTRNAVVFQYKLIISESYDAAETS